MSFFTTNYQDMNTFEPVPEGTYEAVISEVSKETFSTGNQGLKLTLTIRSDIDQPQQLRKVFDNLVASEKAMFKFQQVARAVGIAEGVNIPSLEAFGKMIMYKHVQIVVKHRKNEYNGETRIQEQVTYKPSQAQAPQNQQVANPFDIPTPLNISDDDIPF